MQVITILLFGSVSGAFGCLWYKLVEKITEKRKSRKEVHDDD